MKYRSRVDIAAAILEITKEGARKSSIMYQAYLSFPQLKGYLTLLTEAGLIKYTEQKKTFHITEKGTRFLNMYTEVDAMIPKTNMLTKVKE